VLLQGKDILTLSLPSHQKEQNGVHSLQDEVKQKRISVCLKGFCHKYG